MRRSNLPTHVFRVPSPTKLCWLASSWEHPRVCYHPTHGTPQPWVFVFLLCVFLFLQVETGTFTLSNLGAYGVKNFAPIVRMPQACALALGAAEERVIPNEGDKKKRKSGRSWLACRISTNS